MEYCCRCYDEFGEVTHWKSEIKYFREHEVYYEIKVKSKKSTFTFIYGKTRDAYFICIPEFYLGSYIYEPRCRLKNIDMLQIKLDIFDATTIADILYYLQRLEAVAY